MVVNGLGETECASLMNDTGLNPSVGHDDCTDLGILNDCLVGSEIEELEKADYCDWKEFTEGLLKNLWTMFEAFKCAVCGIWTNIHSLTTRMNNAEADIDDLEDRATELCRLVDQSLSPVLTAYGTLPLTDDTSRRCGTVTAKVIQKPNDGTLNPYTKKSQNVGIKYAKMVRTSCSSDEQEMLEWILPDTFMYELASGASDGDLLWKITKTEAQSILGMSDFLWTTFTQSNWTWDETKLAPSHQIAWLQLGVGIHGLTTDEMGVFFLGCTAPNDAIIADQTMNPISSASARLYRHTI